MTIKKFMLGLAVTVWIGPATGQLTPKPKVAPSSPAPATQQAPSAPTTLQPSPAAESARRQTENQEIADFTRAMQKAVADGGGNNFTPGTYAWEVHRKVMSRLVAEPTFARYLYNSIKALPAKDRTPAAGEAMMERIMSDGIPRLSDEMLDKYFIADSGLVERANGELCAALAMNKASMKEKMQLMEKLPPNVVDTYYEVLVATVMASVERKPAKRLTQKQKETVEAEVLASLSTELPEHLRDGVLAALNRQAEDRATPQDMCLLTRTMFSYFLTVKPPVRYWIWRSLSTN